MSDPVATSRASMSIRERMKKDERGMVLIWFALMMTLLFGFAGFSVDIGNWYLHIQRAQTAADAASLAGDAHLPYNLTAARQAAYDTLIRNGVPQVEADRAFANTSCAGGGPCIAQVPTAISQLEVRVNTTTKNAFLGLLGVQRQNSFVRGAIADHLPGLTFGGLSNVLGAEPIANPADGPAWEDPSYATMQGNYWLSIAGREAQKAQGDRYANWRCDGYPGNNGGVATGETDLCPSGNNNSEYDSEGYWYTFTTQPGVTGRYLGVEIYDAPYINVGGTGCGANGLNAYEMSAAVCARDDTDGPDPTGDQMTTRYRLWSKDKSTLLCDHTFVGWNEWVPTMKSSNPSRGGDDFNSVFQRWYSLCYVPINGAQENQFQMQVTSGPQNGRNSFSLRSGIFGATNRASINMTETQQKTKVSVLDSFSMVNTYVGNVNVQFPLTRIPPVYAGQTINFELYDIGDNPNASGSPSVMSIVGSSDLSTPTTSWQCQFDMPNSPRSQPLTNMSNCSVQVYRTDWNAKIARLSLRVPASYSCNAADPKGCWTFVSMRFGVTAGDVTTWTLREPGKPLRLEK